MTSSAPLIITGMHRSGTSLVAGVLHAAGVSMGQDQHEPGPHNPGGYFEDRDFVALHDTLLERNGTSMYLEHARLPMPVPEDLQRRAQSLLEARRADDPWGWKDPRTTLFLDLWTSLAPEAVCLFVYRQPASVVESLRRRGDPALRRYFPGAWLLTRLGFEQFRRTWAVDLWLAYNRCITRFAAENPHRSLLVPFDRLLEELPVALERLRDRHGVPVGDADLSAVDESRLRGTGVRADVRRACDRHDVAETLQELDELSRS